MSIYNPRRILCLLCLCLVPITLGCGDVAKSKLKYYEKGVSAFNEAKFNVAVIEFKNAVSKDPNYFEARFYLGRTYLNTGKVESAEREFKKVLKLNPDFKDALLPLAKALHRGNKLDEAIETISSYLETRPEDVDALETAAAIYASRNDFTEAHNLLSKSLALDSGRASAYVILGNLHTKQGNLEEARKALEKAISLDSKNQLKPLYGLAVIELRANNEAKALEYYDRILKIDPEQINAMAEMSLIHIRQGRLDLAMETAEKLLAMNKDRPEGHYIMGLVHLRKKESGEAVLDFQNVLKYVRNHAAANFFLGQALFEEGSYEQAISVLRRAIKENKNLYQPHVLLSMIYQEKRRAEDAVIEGRKAVQKAPGSATAHHTLGSAYMLMEKFDLAFVEFDNSIELDPGIADTYLKRGVYFLQAGKGDEAAKEFETALKVDPKSVRSRLTAAIFYLKQKDYLKAIDTCKDGLDGGASDAILYNVIGVARLATGDEPAAEESFRKAIKVAPAFAAPYFNLARHYMTKNEQEKALSQYEALTLVDPENVPALLKAAALLEKLGRSKKAKEKYIAAGSLGPAEGSLALAAYYARNKEYDLAEKTADELLSREPENLRARNFKGMLYFQKRELEKARKEYEKIKRARPDLVAGYMKLAAAYEASGDYEAALSELRQAVAKAPKNKLVLAQMAGLHIKKKDFSSAISTADTIIKMDPGSGLGHYLKALAYLSDNGGNNRQDEKAEKLLLKARKLAPKNGQVLMTLGALHIRQSRYKEALKTFKDVLRLSPGSGVIHYNIATAHERLGDKKAAIESYRLALKVLPDHIASLNNLAFLYADTDTRLDEAVTLAKRAFKLSKGRPQVADTLGWALYKTGKLDEALKHIRAAALEAPGNSSIQYHLGLVYLKKGENNEAKQALQQALETPQFPERGKAEKLLNRL